MTSTVLVCVNQRLTRVSCDGAGSAEIAQALETSIARRNLDAELIRVHCFGRCNNGPTLRIVGRHFRHRATLDDVPQILSELETLMMNDQTILARLGVRPVINGCGVYTDVGGSRLSPRV